MPRTNHSIQIGELREVAEGLDRVYAHTGQEQYRHDALSSRAAADLLEIHDATGINLFRAPNLLAFVLEVGGARIGKFDVVDNHA
jgi:hypothetical protein